MILEANFRGALSIDNLPYPTEPDYKQVAAKVNATTTELKQKLIPDYFALLEQLLTQLPADCFRTSFAALSIVTRRSTFAALTGCCSTFQLVADGSWQAPQNFGQWLCWTVFIP